jgi:hypothetical protein
MNASTPRPGLNARLARTPFGYAYSAAGGSGGNYPHPFKARLGPAGITLSRGLIISQLSFEPTINKVPISGDANGKIPSLALDPSVAVNGLSFACVEVTPNADGTLDVTSPVQIVHRAQPTSNEATTGRQPLCLVIWNGKNPAGLLQITFFNLRYFRSAPSATQGLPKHFFL